MKRFIAIALVFVLLSAISAQQVFAVMSSTNYKIENDVLGSGGSDVGSSASYLLRDSIGGISSQGSESASYQVNSGLRQGIYDQIASFSLHFQDRATQVGATALAGTTVTVSTVAGMSVGDMVMIVQDEGAAQVTAMARITSISDPDIILDSLATNGTTPVINGANDYVYVADGSSLSFGTLNTALLSTAVVGWEVDAEQDEGYSIYVYDDGDFTNGTDTVPDVADGSVTVGSSEYGARSSDTSLSESTFDTQDAAITENFQQVASRATGEFDSRDFLTLKASISNSQPGGNYASELTVVYVGDY